MNMPRLEHKKMGIFQQHNIFFSNLINEPEAAASAVFTINLSTWGSIEIRNEQIRKKQIEQGRKRGIERAAEVDLQGNEFVMDVSDTKQRWIIESYFGQILGQVTVFGKNGRRGDFRLRKDTTDSGYVFAGKLSIIYGNENIDQHHEIELWGYPDQNLSVLVLTVGVSSQ
ncbi:hypothetical protein ACLOJK_028181 [Asimina triloba]